MIELKRIYDISTLMQWRMEVLRCVFNTEPDADVITANRRYYDKHLADNTHIAYNALVDGIPAGCAAVCLYDELPSPDNPGGRCAYCMNIYVRPQFRKRGIASALTGRLIEDAKMLRCQKIYLEASAMGMPLYHKLGFKDMAGMMKYEDCNI